MRSATISKTYNRRLLDYVKGGGNLIVLYNTQEFVPNRYAPYPATLPAGAEEVSEEDSPIEILAPDAPVLNTPNRITKVDFDNWVEQRGSKFWDDVGCAVHADDCHVGQGPAAAKRRMAARAGTAKGTTRTSRTRSTGSCRTACRVRIVCWPTCFR